MWGKLELWGGSGFGLGSSILLHKYKEILGSGTSL